MTFLINLEFTEILYRFELVLEGKACKEIYESSRLEVFERSSRNHFALSDTEDSTSGSSYSEGTADLPLLRTLLIAIRQKWQEPSFWEVIDIFVLLAYASLAASRTFLQ